MKSRPSTFSGCGKAMGICRRSPSERRPFPDPPRAETDRPLTPLPRNLAGEMTIREQRPHQSSTPAVSSEALRRRQSTSRSAGPFRRPRAAEACPVAPGKHVDALLTVLMHHRRADARTGRPLWKPRRLQDRAERAASEAETTSQAYRPRPRQRWRRRQNRH